MRLFTSQRPLLKTLFLKERWFLAIRPRSGNPLGYRNTTGYHLLRPPRDRFYADPFLLKHNNVNYLFFEDYRYVKAKGVISCMALNEAGWPTSEIVALERPYHLSFPFVFSWANEIWLVPETSSNRTVELYRAKRFPEQWELETVLMSAIHASDTTLLFHADKWWLFTEVENAKEYRYNNLSLFYADSLFGHWTPHLLNPVVADVSRSRPAGRIFEDYGALIRPSQDCTSHYGRAIQFNQIEILDENRYQERTVGTITPDWTANCLGTHTYGCNEDFEVLDGYTVKVDLRGKWLSLLGMTKHWLRKRAA
jgi:hypothetical protein